MSCDGSPSVPPAVVEPVGLGTTQRRRRVPWLRSPRSMVLPTVRLGVPPHLKGVHTCILGGLGFARGNSSLPLWVLCAVSPNAKVRSDRTAAGALPVSRTGGPFDKSQHIR